MNKKLLYALCISMVLFTILMPFSVAAKKKSTVEIPSKYDLRDLGMVSPVKDMGSFPFCWAYASMASIESNALMQGFGEYDLSEYQAAFISFNNSENAPDSIKDEGLLPYEGLRWTSNGGSPWFVASAFMGGYAIIEEKDDNYYNKQGNDFRYSLSGNLFLDSCYMVPISDFNTIKELVMNNGAVVFEMCYDGLIDNKYNKDSNIYIPEPGKRNEATGSYSYSGFMISHCMAIVGWDDDYDASNFQQTPPGNGAFIIKNSYGIYDGKEGYYYISYYDACFSLERNAYSFIVKNEQNFDKVYQYDGSRGALVIDNTSGAAINFTTENYEKLTGIRIWPKIPEDTNEFKGCTATISIYTGSVNDDDNKLIYTQDCNIEYAGYQTLEFDQSIKLDKETPYNIEISFDTPVSFSMDGNYMPKDEEYLLAEFVASANPEETYIKIAGEKQWLDAYDNIAGDTPCSACIKVLSKKLSPTEYLPFTAIKIAAYGGFALTVILITLFTIITIKTRKSEEEIE